MCFTKNRCIRRKWELSAPCLVKESQNHLSHFLWTNCGHHSISAHFLTVCGTSGRCGTHWRLPPARWRNMSYIKKIHNDPEFSRESIDFQVSVAIKIAWPNPSWFLFERLP
jgi:hypothetical protein